MRRRIRLLLCGIMVFFLISAYPTAIGWQQKIDDLPPTERGTDVVISITYPDSPFHVDQYFEVSLTFQVKHFGDMVDQIYVRWIFIRLSVNFRDYSAQGGPFKIVSSDESAQRTFGFYLAADEVGVFPGQLAGARLDYRIKWTECGGSGADIEHDIAWRLVDYIEIRHSALPEGVTGRTPPLTSVQPIFSFEILPVIAALLAILWVRRRGKNSQ